MTRGNVSRKFSVLLDEPTRAAISDYARANQMNPTQAVRVLLALALRGEADVNEAFRRAAFREGVILGVGRIREQFVTQMQGVVQSALNGLENV